MTQKIPFFTLDMLDYAEHTLDKTMRDAELLNSYAHDLYRDMEHDEQVIKLIQKIKNMADTLNQDAQDLEDLFIRGEY